MVSLVSALRTASDTTVVNIRQALANLAGLTFGGLRDLYATLGYQRELLPNHYHARYKRNAIAKRIVEALPKDTWRAGGELVDDEDPEKTTPFEEAWNELAERLQLWPTFARADILAGLGRFAVILIGVPGRFEEPLPDRLQPDDIKYLTPFGEIDVRVDKLVSDTQDERFGLPEYYMISRIGGGTSLPSTNSGRGTRVHHTRVLHIADGLLSDRVYGQPRLEGVWNYLDDLEKVVGGGSEAFWLRVHQGFHFNLDPNVAPLDQPQKDALKEKAEAFAHGMSRTLATQGMEVEVFGSDVANFSAPVDSIMTLIAGGTGIPKRILLGSERGELASSQDRTNWNDRVTDRRNDFAEPAVVRPFVKLLLDRGALPEPKDGHYDVRWPEMQFLSEQEQADVAAKWAGLNTKETVVLPDEIRDRVLGLPPLKDVMTPEQLEEEEARHEAAINPPAMQPGFVGEQDVEDEEEFVAAASAELQEAQLSSAVAEAYAAAAGTFSEAELEAALAEGEAAVDALIDRAVGEAERTLVQTMPQQLLTAVRKTKSKKSRRMRKALRAAVGRLGIPHRGRTSQYLRDYYRRRHGQVGKGPVAISGGGKPALGAPAPPTIVHPPGKPKEEIA